MLDYDGTLAPFRDRPEDAVPHDGVLERLARIMDNPANRLMIVSGRPIKSLAVLLALPNLPELWGGHGWEYRPQGGETRFMPLSEMADAALSVAAMQAVALESLGARIERKRASVAVHWRGLQDVETPRRRVLEIWRGYAEDHPLLHLLPFDGGVEVRVNGNGKGNVVREVLANIQAGTKIAYVGDDLTDEEAFRELGAEGLSVLVRNDDRLTAADLVLRTPAELLTFLDVWV